MIVVNGLELDDGVSGVVGYDQLDDDQDDDFDPLDYSGQPDYTPGDEIRAWLQWDLTGWRRLRMNWWLLVYTACDRIENWFDRGRLWAADRASAVAYEDCPKFEPPPDDGIPF